MFKLKISTQALTMTKNLSKTNTLGSRAIFTLCFPIFRTHTAECTYPNESAGVSDDVQAVGPGI